MDNDFYNSIIQIMDFINYADYSDQLKSIFIDAIDFAEKSDFTGGAIKKQYRYRFDADNKDGFRNFVLILPQTTCLNFHLWRNNYGIDLSSIVFNTVTDSQHNGDDWIKTKARTKDEARKVFDIINTLYQNAYSEFKI